MPFLHSKEVRPKYPRHRSSERWARLKVNDRGRTRRVEGGRKPAEREETRRAVVRRPASMKALRGPTKKRRIQPRHPVARRAAQLYRQQGRYAS